MSMIDKVAIAVPFLYGISAILGFVGGILTFVSKPVKAKDGSIPAEFQLYQMMGSVMFILSLLLIGVMVMKKKANDSKVEEVWSLFGTTMMILLLLSSLACVVYIAKMGSSFSTQKDQNTKGAVGVISSTLALTVITIALQIVVLLKFPGKVSSSARLRYR